MREQKVTFTVNEQCLAVYGPLLYEVKILQVFHEATPDGDQLYLLHFVGWNKKWDMNLNASLLRKDTADNRLQQKH